MKGLLQKMTVATAALVAVACLDMTSPSSSLLSLSDMLATLPAGFSSTDNTFGPSGDTGGAFMPQGRDHDGMREHGMMGGGMGLGFLGGIGFGRGPGDGPFHSFYHNHTGWNDQDLYTAAPTRQTRVFVTLS